MTTSAACQLSVVVPLFNERAGLQDFHESLLAVLDEATPKNYEILYCDDGSTDGTAVLVRQLHASNPRVKLIALSRNFGKENALSAGIAAATGHAIIMLDGDGQHPVQSIPEFLAAWKSGGQVILGICTNRRSDSWLKRFGSQIFYRLFNRLTSRKLQPGLTDFRLIDRDVQEAFLGLQETDRITRGLIDWLGFRRVFVQYQENVRTEGTPSYGLGNLMGLAANSFISLTPTPLYIFGYLGVFITFSAFLLGLAVLIEQLLLGDPWRWNFTGTAMLGILLLFLVGIVLMSQGILSLYVSRTHSQSKQRPLYVIDYAESAGIRKKGAGAP